MSDNIFHDLDKRLRADLAAACGQGVLPPLDNIENLAITLEPPRDPVHGDLATNVALVLAKPLRLSPRAIAEVLLPFIQAWEECAKADIAGPGFINMTLKADFWQRQLAIILQAGNHYGDSRMGKGQKVTVEFVSTNPTGPLHVGHARGSVVGDCLSGLLEKAGYEVTREYYVNDAGAQIDKLSDSLWHRAREAMGEQVGDIPDGLYPGDYLIAPSQELAEMAKQELAEMEKGKPALPQEALREKIRPFAVDSMMAIIKTDLEALGVRHDVFSSEKALVDSGAVDEMMERLTELGLLYHGTLDPPKGKPPPDDWEPRTQLLFRATEFGDDCDRPLRKSDGSWTYFATDIAYHYDKWRRGFSYQINVWGADHAGYVRRVQSALTAISEGKAHLTIKICQMVKFVSDGQPLKMSKRSGNFVSLQDLIDAVGADVVRFYLLTRKPDAPLDFDLERVKDQSRDNPVFYVHYAHARTVSVLRQAATHFGEVDLTSSALAKADHGLLASDAERHVLKTLSFWPRQVEAAALAEEPHRIVYYLQDLAGAFHALWTMGKEQTELRFIQPDDVPGTKARLALVQGVKSVLASGLSVLGITPLDELR